MDTNAKASLRAAVKNAIESMGLAAFKRTSFFAKNWRVEEEVKKAA